MKIRFLLYLLIASVSTYAQTSVPNGNFENWNNLSYLNPQNYPFTSNYEAIQVGLPVNCERSTDAYHGAFAVKLTTIANSRDTMFAYLVNTRANDEPKNWHGGTAISGTPTAVRGYYKCNIAPGDTGLVIITFSKNGVNLGEYGYRFTGSQNTYTLFTVPIFPPLSQAPDSMVFGATSSNAMQEWGIPGSMLLLDSISLVGVATQPAGLNGDFETWENVEHYRLANWFTSDNPDRANIRSTDAYKGAYAITLTSVLRDNDGSPRNESGYVSTGYYERDCNPCFQKGGYPFSNTADTIAFWYKFTPKGGAKANVHFRLLKNGGDIGGNQVILAPATSYTYAELPFQSFQAPDTLIVNIQSSAWEDSLVSQVGSTLTIDEIHLKSQPLHTGLSNSIVQPRILAYPNPATDRITIQAGFGQSISGISFTLVNIMGQVVYAALLDKSKTEFDVSELARGMYFYKIQKGQTFIKGGTIMLE